MNLRRKLLLISFPQSFYPEESWSPLLLYIQTIKSYSVRYSREILTIGVSTNSLTRATMFATIDITEGYCLIKMD